MLCYRKIVCTFVAALLVLCLGWEVRAESISIVASDNAWVRKNQATTDQSEEGSFMAKSNGSDGESKLTYLRFDVSPLAGATITSASLDLYLLWSQDNDSVYVCALNDLAIGAGGTTETSWSGNLTWNTRPSGTATLPNANTSDRLASLPFKKEAPQQLVSFDLTSALPGLLESDTNDQLTLIVYASINKDNRFASLDNTGGYPVPMLNVGYEPIPEPGTLTLIGMALLGLGWYAWRKRR